MLTESLLITEYGNAKREQRRLRDEASNLTVGSVQKKKISGKEYYYLAFRKDGKVVTKYISREDVDRMLDETLRRRGINMTIKQLREVIRLIEKAIGREKANRMHIEKCVRSIVEANPEYGVTKVTLFGSRATSRFRDDSDVDLLIEYDKPHISLFKQAGLQTKLSEELGLDVDLVHAPLPPDSMLKIDNTRVIYEAS